MFDRIIVGWDGSDQAAGAVRWIVRSGIAAKHATVVRVLDARTHGADVSTLQRQLDEEVAVLQMGRPDVRVAGDLVVGVPEQEFADRSDTNTLVVLGRSTAKRPTRFRFSLPSRVAARSRGPVAVVPFVPASTNGPVVVAVDGSESSAAAAELGASLAQSAVRDLVLVHAWQQSGDPDAAIAEDEPDASAILLQAHRELLSAMSATVREAHPRIRIHERLVHDTPEHALAESSRGASVLLLGKHDRWDLASLLLGSVAHATLLDAPAPTILVPRSMAMSPEASARVRTELIAAD